MRPREREGQFHSLGWIWPTLAWDHDSANKLVGADVLSSSHPFVVTLIIEQGQPKAKAGSNYCNFQNFHTLVMFSLHIKASTFRSVLIRTFKMLQFSWSFYFNIVKINVSTFIILFTDGAWTDVFTAIIPICDPYSRSFNFYLHFDSTEDQWERSICQIVQQGISIFWYYVDANNKTFNKSWKVFT